MTPPRVIGLGSHHGDDQAGWLIVDRLQELGYPLTQLRKSAHPADLFDELSSHASLLVCDACDGSGETGVIHRWRWPTDSVRNLRSGGTHDMPLAQVLEMSEQFADHRLCVEIWGVMGSNWIPVSQPHRAVQDAAREVADQIWKHYGA